MTEERIGEVRRLRELTQLTLPALDRVLVEIEFFERERTERHGVEMAILLYDYGVSLRTVERVQGRIGIERSQVAIWKWIQTFGQRLDQAGRRPAVDLPAVCLLDEIAIGRHGEEFTLLAAVDPNTRRLLHAEVAPARDYLTT